MVQTNDTGFYSTVKWNFNEEKREKKLERITNVTCTHNADEQPKANEITQTLTSIQITVLV